MSDSRGVRKQSAAPDTAGSPAVPNGANRYSVRTVRTGDVPGWRTVVSDMPLGGDRTVTPIAESGAHRPPDVSASPGTPIASPRSSAPSSVGGRATARRRPTADYGARRETSARQARRRCTADGRRLHDVCSAAGPVAFHDSRRRRWFGAGTSRDRTPAQRMVGDREALGFCRGGLGGGRVSDCAGGWSAFSPVGLGRRQRCR